MQTRPTRQLARILAATLKTASFRETARQHKILTADGRPDPGLVKLLVNGYEPINDITRARLGLPPLPYCTQCHRRRPMHTNESKPPVQPEDEPARRVLSGAWFFGGQWVDIETVFGVSR